MCIKQTYYQVVESLSIKTDLIFHIPLEFKTQRFIDFFYDLQKKFGGEVSLPDDLDVSSHAQLNLSELVFALDTVIEWRLAHSKYGLLDIRLYPWLDDACEMIMSTELNENRFKEKIEEFWLLFEFVVESLDPWFGYTCVSDINVTQSKLDKTGYPVYENISYFGRKLKEFYTPEAWVYLASQNFKMKDVSERGILFYKEDEENIVEINQDLQHYFRGLLEE